MFNRSLLMIAAGGGALALASAQGWSQSPAGPPVRYTLDAETVSGLGGMAGGGMSGAMAIMQGGAPKASRRMVLRHGGRHRHIAARAGRPFPAGRHEDGRLGATAAAAAD